MSKTMPGFHKKAQISLQTRRQFHIAALRVMLTKAQQATTNNEDYFLPETFQKFTVHLYRLFSPNIEVNDLAESFTEIIDKLAGHDDCTKTLHSEHSTTNSEIPSEFEIEYTPLESDLTLSRNAHPLFMKNSEPILPKPLQNEKRKNGKTEKTNKCYYSTIKKLDQYSNPKNYSDTDSDEFLSLSKHEDHKNNDYVNPSAKMINKMCQWQTAKAPEIFDIPFVTEQNMKKLMFYPSGHYLNVPHSVRNMSVLGNFRDITHSHPKLQKPKKSIFRKYFGSPFDLPKLPLPENYISKSALINQNALSGIALR